MSECPKVHFVALRFIYVCFDHQKHHYPSYLKLFTIKCSFIKLLLSLGQIPLCVLNLLVSYVPLLFQHQQQVAAAVERAKQVTMTELNAIIGVSAYSVLPSTG